MNQFNFIQIHNALDPRDCSRETRSFKLGQSLAELLPTPTVVANVAYTINGRVLDADELALTYPQDGDYVTSCVIPRGGDDGKSILRIVAMIAVAVVAPEIGAFLGSEMLGGAVLGMGATGWTVATMVAGSLLVNALLPPPKPPAGQASEHSSTYGIDGAKNTSAEGIVVPVCYGQFRMGGNILSNYVVNDGDSQWLYMLLCAGEGEVGAIARESLLINDQPLDAYGADGALPEFEFSPGSPTQNPPKWFASTNVPISVGKKFSTAYGVADTVNEVDRIRVDVAAPSGMFYANDDGSISSTHVEINLQYRRWKSGQNNDPWLDFQSTTQVVGYRGRKVYNDRVTVDEFGNELSRTPYEPTGFEREVAGVLYLNGSDRDEVVGHVVDDPVYSEAGTMVISGSQRSAIRRSFMSPRLPQGRYEVRYRRTTEEDRGDSPHRFDSIYLTDLVGVINEKVAYRHTATVAVKIKLSDHLNGIPTITYLSTGKLVDVWEGDKWVRKSSANPAWICMDILTNSRYGGGASRSRLDMPRFKEWAAWCDANSFEFHGVFDTASNIWDAANQVARCGRAQLIQIGTRFSIVIERQDTPVMLFNVANMISGTFKETWLPLSDRANEVEITYTDKADDYAQRTLRVLDTAAQAAGQPARKATVQLMGVVDAERAYSEAMLALNLNRYILRTVSFSAPIDAIACVVGDLILVQHDMPKWGAGGRLEDGSTTSVLKLDRTVFMEAGKTYQAMVHLDSVRRVAGTVKSVVGDTILLNGYVGTTDVRRLLINGKDMEILSVEALGGAFGVRVESASGIAAGNTYELHDTNVLVKRGVVNTATVGNPVTTNTITLTTTLDFAPAQYAKWTFGESNKVNKPFRVKSITGSHEYRREIAAIEYNETIYDPATAVATPNYSSLSWKRIKQAVIDGVTEEVFFVGGVYQARVIIAYHGQQDQYQASEVFVSRNGGSFVSVGRDKSQAVVTGVKGERLEFRVVAIIQDGTNAPLENAPTETYTVVCEVPIPDAVVVGGGLEGSTYSITWTAPRNASMVAGYQIRHGESWADGLVVAETDSVQYRAQATWGGVRRFWVAARNIDGVFGAATSVEIEVPMPSAVTPASQLDGTNILLEWPAPASPALVTGFQIRAGETWETAVMIGETDSLNYRVKIDWVGAKRFWVAARGLGGSLGPSTAVDATVPTPGAVAVTGALNGATYTLSWTAPTGQALITGYQVRTGDDWETAVVVGDTDSVTYRVPVGWGGLRRFWVAARGIGGAFGAASFVEVTIAAPAKLTTQSALEDRTFVLTWTTTDNPALVAGYQVRLGTDWDHGSVLLDTELTVYRVDANWAGSKKVMVAARGLDGIYGPPTVVDLVVPAPDAIAISSDLDGANYVLRWQAPANAALVTSYIVRVGDSWNGAASVGETTSLEYRARIDWGGVKRFWVVARSIGGAFGTPAFVEIAIGQPTVSKLTASVREDDATYLLEWQVTLSGAPVSSYEIRQGSAWESSAIVAITTELSRRAQIDWCGDRIFWVTATDTAGNSSSPKQVVVHSTTADIALFDGDIGNTTYKLTFATRRSSPLVVGYELRYGATWDGAKTITKTPDRSYESSLDWRGLRTFWVAAYDATGAYGLPASVDLYRADDGKVFIDDNGFAKVTFPVWDEPQVIGYEVRVGSSWDKADFVLLTNDNFFTVSLLNAYGKTYWIKGKYGPTAISKYTISTTKVSFADDLLPAPTGIKWSIAEPIMTFRWDAVAGAIQYLVLWEDMGLTRTRALKDTTTDFYIPRGNAVFRVIAVAENGGLSQWSDEEISLLGAYSLNEVVAVDLPISTGNYVNLAFNGTNTIRRVGLLGESPQPPYAQNINDADLFAFGYNLANLAASQIQGTPAEWFRHGFWREESGFYESSVIDLGDEYSGRLIGGLTKSVTSVGNGPVSAINHVSTEYLSESTAQDLIDERAFVSANIQVATTLTGNSSDWKPVETGDWVTARYVRLAVYVTMASALTSVTITKGFIAIDVPDMTEDGSVAGVTSAGTPVTLKKQFRRIKTVVATARGAALAHAQVSPTNALSLFTNSTTPTQVDYFVKGY